MVTLPSLAHLYLGVPTAGKESKRRVAKAANPPPPPAKNAPDTGPLKAYKKMENIRNGIIEGYKKKIKKKYGVDVLRGRSALALLKNVVGLFWRAHGVDVLDLVLPVNPDQLHLELHHMQRVAGVVAAGQPDAIEAEAQINDYLKAIAMAILSNYVIKESPDGQFRNEEEIYEIINKPDVELMAMAFLGAVATFKPQANNTFFRYVEMYYTYLVGWWIEQQEQKQNAPRPPREKPEKGTAEYDRNVQANKDREEREEKEQLANSKEEKEKKERARAEHEREKASVQQEREDQLARQLQRTNLAGSSDDHAQQESLSPVSEAKRVEAEKQKEEAKQKDIAKKKALLQEQQAEKDRIAAAEADRQAERAAKRETGERIQTGR